MSAKRTCSDSTKELLAKKIRSKWSLDTPPLAPAVTFGTPGKIITTGSVQTLCAANPGVPALPFVNPAINSPSPVVSTITLTPTALNTFNSLSTLNPAAPLFIPNSNSVPLIISPQNQVVSLSAGNMTTTRHQAALRREAEQSKPQNVPAYPDVLLEGDEDPMLSATSSKIVSSAKPPVYVIADEDTIDLSSTISMSSKVPKVTIKINQPASQPSTPAKSAGADASLLNSPATPVAALQSVPSKDLSAEPSQDDDSPMELCSKIPSPPPPPPILASALHPSLPVVPAGCQPTMSSTAVALEDIKQLLNSEIQKSVDASISKALEDPEKGILSQLTAINYLVTDPTTGLQSVVSDHTQKLASQKTSLSNICTRMDTLESSLVPLKSLAGKTKYYETKLSGYDNVSKDFRSFETATKKDVERISSLENTVNDTEDGMVAVALKVHSLHNDVNHADSGLIAKVDSLQSNFKKISDALSNGDHEIVLKTQPTDLDEHLSKFKNDLRAETDAHLIDFKEELVAASPAPAEVTQKMSSLQQQLHAVAARNTLLEQKVSTLTSISQVQHAKMIRLHDNVIQNAAKHMKDELIIGGIRQSQGENPIGAVKRFFRSKMGLNAGDSDVLEAERGKASTPKVINGRTVTIPPVMFVRLSLPFSRLVTKNTWKLARKKDDIDGYGYYIHVSSPEALRAVR